VTETAENIPPTGMLIGGKWVESSAGRHFTVNDPASGEALAELPEAVEDDVKAATASAAAALPGWSRTDAAARGRILLRLADLLDEHGQATARLETTDNGRPIRETRAQAGIVAKWYRYFGGMADKVEGATIPVEGRYLNYTQRVPVGVCGAITPWNHPTLIASKKIAPALAFGNTVVAKPSELAPLGVLELGRLAQEAGLPPGVLNIVTGGREAGAALVADPLVARIDVTGSTRTGVAVAAAAATSVKRVGLELGGAASTLVFADADLDRSVRGAVFAAMIAQGQSCVAAARVLVDGSIAREFADRMASMVAALRVGDPLDEKTQVGPVITPEAASRVSAYVQSATDGGARVLAGGRAIDGLGGRLRPDAFQQPTLLWRDQPDPDLFQEEVFGPVLTVIPFGDEQEAVTIANSTPFGLGAGIWTRDVSRAHRVAEALRAGIIWVNDYHRTDPASPWGGFGMSGYGRENGFAAVEMFTEVKSVWVGLEDRPMDWYDEDSGQRLN
jgi:acyl-CoA reductase-like NAD-dependent aldehyde dehydrogenase